MFKSRKQEMELFQKTLDILEKNQSNNEVIINSVYHMVEKNGIQDKEIQEKEIDKKKAAYALNLCMVSVSQIVDYNDSNILEQEYETILNNLNLEHMPKDEELLNVLKQLLDTITFFRIQEGDKKYIEMQYQQKMKNAIWSGIPNFGLIVAGGNPVTMAVSLASQVGIGYMNYRKAKAENELEKEQKQWQLQRAAIEQFNGLRRELFDAAWRLAAKYDFKDEYRLTEKQITQYNSILMDGDPYRKYERLEAIKKKFDAYPPFWYYLGHAANSIAQLENYPGGDKEIFAKYQLKAIELFDKYIEQNEYPLLREDHITSSCALEYIDLLNPEIDSKKIKKLIEMAIKMSGMECDILQLCAINYLKIKDCTSAISIFKYLINEGYNDVMNAQILSSILVSGYMGEIKDEFDFALEYKMLSKKVSPLLLFPFPKPGEQQLVELQKQFIEDQQTFLMKKYVYVVKRYIEKKQIEFNKSIPNPYENKSYQDIFYLDYPDHRQNRYNEYQKALVNQENKMNFGNRLSNSNFALLYLDVFNLMINEMNDIIPTVSDKSKDQVIELLVETLNKKVLDKKEDLNKILLCSGKEFTVSILDKLFEMSFGNFTDKYFETYIEIVGMHVKSLYKMDELSREDSMLRKFCNNHDSPVYKTVSILENDDYDTYTGDVVYFRSDILGGAAFEKAQNRSLLKKMLKKFDESVDSILNNNTNKKQNNFIYKYNDNNKKAYNTYLRKKKYTKSNSDLQAIIFAVLEDKSLGISKKDLIFTIEGIIIDKMHSIKGAPIICKYSNIGYDSEDGTLVFTFEGNEKKYDNKNININELNKLIQILADIEYASDEKRMDKEGPYINYIDDDKTIMIETTKIKE